MQLIKNLILAASFSLLSFAASAAVVFENGTDGAFWGGNNPFTYQIVTNSFSLHSDAVLTSLTYNAFTTDETVPVSNVLVNFYANNDGAIGSLLFSQNLNVSSTNVIGADGYYSYTDFTIGLPNFLLDAGNYFLGLQVAPEQFDMHWSIVGDAAEGGEYGDDGFAHYFRLESNPTSVPEPSALLLLGLGIAGLGAARARKAA